MDRIERDARVLCEAHIKVDRFLGEQDAGWLAAMIDAGWRDHAAEASNLHAAGYRIIPVEASEAAIERLGRKLWAKMHPKTPPPSDFEIYAPGSQVHVAMTLARAAHRAVVEGDE